MSYSRSERRGTEHVRLENSCSLMVYYTGQEYNREEHTTREVRRNNKWTVKSNGTTVGADLNEIWQWYNYTNVYSSENIDVNLSLAKQVSITVLKQFHHT